MNPNLAEDAKRGGRKPGSGAAQVKARLTQLMDEVFSEGSKEERLQRLRAVRDSDMSGFLEIFVRLLPKDTNIDLSLNRFSSWTPDELRQFIATGEYPNHEEG